MFSRALCLIGMAFVFISAAHAQSMNPEISVDGLFSLSQFSRDNPLVFAGGHDPRVNGFNIQQVELSFGANVDPYFRADAYLVLTGEGTIEIEEAYATTLALPANLQAKAGQFFTEFGRHNSTHPHGWAFVNKPLVLGRYFGGDGLRNPGLRLSWLSPLPWYSEFLVSLQNSTGETMVSFKGEDGTAPSPEMRSLADLVFLGRWNNFFSLSEAWSLNFGSSLLYGPNKQGDEADTKILGADLYLHYRRPGGLSFLGFQIEALRRWYENPSSENTKDWGLYAQAVYRLPAAFERWQLGLRYDLVGPRHVPVSTVIGGDGDPTLDGARRARWSPVLTFFPTEFSKIRFQYDYDKPDDRRAQHAGVIQFEFLMGAHGAHKF